MSLTSSCESSAVLIAFCAVRDLAFGAFAALSVFCALAVVTRRNPIYAAGFLLLSFLGVAGVLIVLDAPFAAGLHVLVYGGAIIVLFLFTIMLLNLRPEELGGEPPLIARGLAAAIAAALFAALSLAFSADATSEIQFLSDAGPPEWGSPRQMGRALLDRYLLPFELVTVLILVAVFGALVLAKRKLPEEP